ncbi:dolichol kinase [Taxawa tesnikishii (nom. ined.)]|nr:dolichol kinase [Dothideales sp. JES 119]
MHDPDSDADEDGFQQLRKVTSAIPSRLQTDGLSSTKHAEEPRSAIEANQNGGMERFPPSRNNNRSEHKRRHTIASLEIPTLLFRREQSSDGRKSRPRARSWYLDLTPAGAALRKWIWALYLYIAIVFIILIPVRSYVTKHALSGAEPVMWALNYLFGGLYPLWTSCTSSADSIHDFLLHFSHEYVSQLPHSLLPVRTFLAAFGPSNTRLILIAYWLLVLTAGLLLNFRLTAYIEVDTRRKVFHGIMVAMLLPSTFVDPCFCALALSLVLAVFLLLEVIRAGQVSPLGPAIGKFVAPYVDGRDLRGPVVVSHAFLLVGCAVPLWLSLAAFPRSNDGWEVEGERREVAMVAGVVCVGMGDAAASLIGRRFGRRKWPWIGGKSLEGSAAFAAAVTVGLMTAKVWLRVGGWSDENARPDEGVLRWVVGLGKAVLAGCGASFMEAVLTGANDNVVVPIALWLLVREYIYRERGFLHGAFACIARTLTFLSL